MFSVALWKLYYKLIKIELSDCFTLMESVMPAATEGYEIRNPSFHTPTIKRKFAECSLYLLLVD